jgi:X-X-X-Leu-X-X-Gly heptad repeat protein
MAIAGLVLGLAAGCGGSDSRQSDGADQVRQGAEQVQQGAEAMAKASGQTAEQMAQGMQQMAQGFQQMAQGAAKPVDFEQLKALLPEVGGWSRSGVRGEQRSGMGFASSRAEAHYAKDDASIELEITDTALSQLLLAPMSMFLATGYEERSDDGYKRATKIGTYPGFEEWNTGSKHGEVTAVIANRFIVKATGRDVADLAPVRQVVDAVSLSKLASLK